MKHNRLGPAFLMLLAILLSACGTQTPAAPTTDPKVVLTSAALTAVARLTAPPSNTPIPTERPLPTATPTMLATPTLFSPVITGTLPVVLPTQTGAAPTGIVSGVDSVVMVSDLDVTDGTKFDSGAKFTKKWRLLNTGTSTWTTGYSLVHTSGDEIKGPSSVPLPIEVGPGKIVDMAVDLTAPSKDGKYTSYWKLKNSSGQMFGVGVGGKDAFWVQIQIGGDANPAPTDTPVGTPGSATATPEATVRHLSLEVDQGTVTAQCPHTFTFTARFRLSDTALVKYHWEASDTMYTLPPVRKETLKAGVHTIPLAFEVTGSNSGWVKFHITLPDSVSTDAVDFALTCTQ